MLGKKEEEEGKGLEKREECREGARGVVEVCEGVWVKGLVDNTTKRLKSPPY